MKTSKIIELLNKWRQVQLDRARRRECLQNTGPGESPYSIETDQLWNGREADLARSLLSAMPELEGLFVQTLMQSVTEIQLGEGKIAISAIGDRECSSILFRRLEQPMPIGQVPPDSPLIGDPYAPHSGDVLLHCPSRESALLLIEAVSVVLGSFSLCDEVPE